MFLYKVLPTFWRIYKNMLTKQKIIQMQKMVSEEQRWQSSVSIAVGASTLKEQ